MIFIFLSFYLKSSVSGDSLHNHHVTTTTVAEPVMQNTDSASDTSDLINVEDSPVPARAQEESTSVDKR